MKRGTLSKICFLETIILLFALTSLSFAMPLWTYGVEDQSSAEFTFVQQGAYAPYYSTDFGLVTTENPGILDSGLLPGYFYHTNPAKDYSHVTKLAVNELRFDFTLVEDYLELELYYGRFGSEINEIYMDGELVTAFEGSGENIYDLFYSPISGHFAAGEHTLSILYTGGGSNNGHFIDFIRLENGITLASQNNLPTPVPEPGTMLIFGTGLITLLGIGAYRKE
jgi:hypothetical protein